MLCMDIAYSNKSRVEWIDFAKGVAILMVIVVHLSQTLPLTRCFKEVASFGAMGVQLFFILSAYCLYMTDKGGGFPVLGGFRGRGDCFRCRDRGHSSHCAVDTWRKDEGVVRK